MFTTTSTSKFIHSRLGVLSTIALMITLLAGSSRTVHADLIAYWSFNGGTDPVSPTIPADIGSGALYLSQWAGNRNYCEGGTSCDTDINAVDGTPGVVALSVWQTTASGLGAGTPIDIHLSMSGFRELEVSFAQRNYGSHMIFAEATWWWATGDDPETFTQLAGVNTAQQQGWQGDGPGWGISWELHAVDFSAVPALNNADTVILRLIPDDVQWDPFDFLNAGFIVDNVQLNATPCAIADIDCNGVVNVFDLLDLLGAWGVCPTEQPPPQGICQGSCGGSISGCSCDADCEIFADCCLAICNHCPSLSLCDGCDDDPQLCPAVTNSCSSDLDDNGTVNVFDLLELLANWG